ncbi:L-ascorbate metabolism protein UlaG, beta-lactamase superfamily [Paracoccus solventivorans]|uniref:L-ascorbate metabolism protein UlaG, beta-lactamase superfamily n=1 Tax=Paracoccus solventivorans TaxID=53463 RepID=A0A1M7IHF7_9RHOB|nr:MBL fold metallo-hydrolase [Paracoccus solventivorans]SHM40109.1 L-ascorbate metabolism protein UlaG, beta-lactamase superfamily [Paracoccus solventivorans]
MDLNRRQTLAGALACTAAAALPAALRAQAAAPTPAAAPGFLTPFEHASLMLTLGGQNILVDPVGGADRYAAAGPMAAVLVTHEHGDHFDPEVLAAVVTDGVALVVNPAVAEKLPEDLRARATVMKNGDSGEIAGIKIEAVPAYNITPERTQYHPQGRDNGYVLSSAEHGRIYIAGDTEATPEFMAQQDIALAFVPMNLPYTMSIDQAVEGVAAMAPRLVIPYHHRGNDPAEFAEKLRAAGSQTQVAIVDWYPGSDDPKGPAD